MIPFHYAATHLLKDIQKGNIALFGCTRNVLYTNPPATDSRDGKEVGSSRGIRLNLIRCKRREKRGSNEETLIPPTFDFDSKILHRGDGHVHVGFGVQVGGDFYFDWRFCIRSDHQ